MNRRHFFKNSLVAGLTVGAGHVLPANRVDQLEVPAFNGKRLVLVKLDGGNDGLFAYLPKTNDIIESRRLQLSRLVKAKGITLQEDWILNSHLSSLMPFIENEELVLLPFVGYPAPNTSHFKATEIWETAQMPGMSSAKTGWIGRLLDEGKLAVQGNDAPAISLSEQEVLVNQGRYRQGFIWQNNEWLDWYSKDIQHWLSHYGNSPLGANLLRQYTLMQWLSDVRPHPGFPATALGYQLAQVTSMIHADKPFRVFYTAQGGYDTHLGAPQRLAFLYEDLGSSLATCIAALKASGHWKETLIFVYSEFGRTIDENTNLGTDHGTAGLCLLLGDNHLVKKYVAHRPEVRFVKLRNELYLDYQIDFRALYQSIESGWLLS